MNNLKKEQLVEAYNEGIKTGIIMAKEFMNNLDGDRIVNSIGKTTK